MHQKYVTRLEPIYSRTGKLKESLSSSSPSSVATADTNSSPVSPRIFGSPNRRVIGKEIMHCSDTAGFLSPKKASPIDVQMADMSKPSSRPSMEMMVEPINLMAMSQLGEPDPTAISKHDLLSAMAFDPTGQILSVGDRGGRVICFNLIENETGQKEFDYLTEFQAHSKSFDVLSSSDISETINCIEWLNTGPSAKPALLASNSRSTKLFRVVNKQVKRCESVKKKL